MAPRTLVADTPGRDFRKRFLWLGIAMAAGMGLLAIQLYRLQIAQAEEYAAKSVANFVKEVRLRADRGAIKDARGTILVDSRPSFDAFLTPAFCQSCVEKVIPKVAELLGMDEAQRQRLETLARAGRRNGPFQPVPILVDLTRDEYDRLNARRNELDGVDIVPVPHRNYRTGNLLSHVIGYMNEITQEELERFNADGASYSRGDYVGRRGLERYFESQLRGTDGVRKEVVDARGQTLEAFNGLLASEDTTRAPVAGHNIILSLDMRLQEAVEHIFPGVAGAVVVIDVTTGFIRALVSRPGFDPNLLTGRITPAQMAALARDPLQPMINRVTAEHYAPGSIFKVVTALAAFKSGQFSPHTVINCPGGYRLGTRVWRCHRDAGHGPRDGRQALMSSCDVWYFKVADVLGIDPISEMGRLLGLGQPTGIGVMAEVPGVMPTSSYHDRVTPGGYFKGAALNSSIGQGDDAVTVMQMALLYSAIANGGTIYKPQLVARVEDATGLVVKESEPEVVRKVDIPEAHLKAVKDGLVATVNEGGGTAFASRLKDVVVAGKTGTAQVARIGAVRLRTHQMDYYMRHHAWFAGFAPADKPEIAVVVLNEHGGGGGTDAAPTGLEVIGKYFELKKQDENAPPPMVNAPYVRSVPPSKKGLPN
ncbi:penicillin-binding protein 2 [Myxococcus stipitatus]|uniref:penicillin-binding protein 2 n=1 Tax=Myxococcus stipitatus TaxID=83455 RepID=UPI003CC8B27D